jgi:predicted Zn-dependent peptidase
MGRHVSSVRRSVTALAEAGLDPVSLDRVRIGQLTDLARAVGSLEVRARAAGGCVLAGRPPDCLAEEAAAWEALTPADTRRAAEKWLAPDAASVLAVLPPGTHFAPPVPGMPARPAF